MLKKVIRHIKDRTLISRVNKKLQIFRKDKGSFNSHNIPAGDTYYGSRAEDYLKVRKKQDYWHLEQEVIKNMLSHFSDGISVLDVPFGTGRFAPFYLEKKMQVYGVDSSIEMIDMARRELEEDFSKCMVESGDAANLPYKDDMFDLVVCVRFLSHVVSFKQAKVILHELNRVAKSSLILQLRIRKSGSPPVSIPEEHESMSDRLDNEQLISFLNDFGFKIRKIESLEDRKTYTRAIFLLDKL